MKPDIAEGVLLPRGFSFASATAGIKASGNPDLALASATPGTSAAAMFTKNRVVAAPLVVGREFLKSTRGRVRAVIVNSGNANCATGSRGITAARTVCRKVAQALNLQPEEVFPSSTGIIGVPLPAEKILAKVPELVAACAATAEAAQQFARAILTTDTRAKMASAKFQTKQGTVTLLGVAKGAGMIHPQMATMLVYLFTDAAASPAELRRYLVEACDQSFNCMSVDGDTSTNDTVLLLASGQSGVSLRTPGVSRKFAQILGSVCQSLAHQIISDGEGVRHVVHLHVEQARTREEALLVARTIANSALVKTAWAGADPNWGRILAAAGRSGVPIDPMQVSIAVGDQFVFRSGQAARFNQGHAHQHLAQRESDVRVLLGRGRASAHFLTTDLTAEYVRINADYST